MIAKVITLEASITPRRGIEELVHLLIPGFFEGTVERNTGGAIEQARRAMH